MSIPIAVQQYRRIQKAQFRKVMATVDSHWRARILYEGMHELGEQGAIIYINKYGRGIGEKKVVHLAMKAEIEECQDMAWGFWKKAYELSTQRGQSVNTRSGKKGMKTPNPIKILFLGSGATTGDSTRLQEEIRAIDHAMRLAKYRDYFDIVQHWAVRATDLQDCLLRHDPDIVHISAQGDSTGIFFLEDDKGNLRSFPPSVLGRLFKVLKRRVRCVVLNACYSIQQANEIALFIDCAIGMTRSIENEAAIAFSIGFYRGLAYGNDVQTSFDMGISEISLHQHELEELYKPRLISNKRNLNEIIFLNITQ